MKREEQPAQLRILVVDDHVIVREGLRLILEGEPDLRLVGDAGDGATALRLVGELQPHVVLMDVRMPGMDGLEAIAQIRQHWPEVAVVILTTYDDDELILKGLRAGASGYLLKDVDRATLFHAIRAAARGETLLSPPVLASLLKSTAPAPVQAQKLSKQEGGSVLTERERSVLEAVARGARNKEIAAHLGISEPTVKTHLANLYAKLNVDSRASAVAVAIERGLLSLVQQRGNEGYRQRMLY
jgi:NarL family two-component system response regulator YdfI